MKKYLLLLFIIMGIFTLVGCGEEEPPKPAEPDYWDSDANGIPDWQEKEITLTYATWQYTNQEMVTMDVLMIEEFTKKYPNITVEMKIVGEEYDWDTNMISLLESYDLPDVFLIRRLESNLPYNMLADITEMYNNDPDTECIFDSVKNSGIYNGKRYAVPTYIYPQFWVVNKTLLSEMNIAIPSYNWTWDQMEAIAKNATNQNKHYIGLYGRQGYYGDTGAQPYYYELPKILKMKENQSVANTWNALSFDGEKFNFTDNTMQTAMNKMADAISGGWLVNSLSAEEKMEYYGAEDFVPTTGGKVAVWREASWSFKDEKDNMTFDWDIYPGPSGVTGGNTDIAGISSLCENQQAAYQLLKWMSFSEDGILTRFNIFTESGEELYQQGNNYPYPVVDYGLDKDGVNKIWDNIPYGSTAPGLVAPEYLEGLRKGSLVLNKEVVGWDAVDYALNSYLNDVISGTTQYAAVKVAMQEAANQEFERIRNELNAYLPK